MHEILGFAGQIKRCAAHILPAGRMLITINDPNRRWPRQLARCRRRIVQRRSMEASRPGSVSATILLRQMYLEARLFYKFISYIKWSSF